MASISNTTADIIVNLQLNENNKNVLDFIVSDEYHLKKLGIGGHVIRVNDSPLLQGIYKHPYSIVAFNKYSILCNLKHDTCENVNIVLFNCSIIDLNKNDVLFQIKIHTNDNDNNNNNNNNNDNDNNINKIGVNLMCEQNQFVVNVQNNNDDNDDADMSLENSNTNITIDDNNNQNGGDDDDDTTVSSSSNSSNSSNNNNNNTNNTNDDESMDSNDRAVKRQKLDDSQ
jgi:hypothetical protein